MIEGWLFLTFTHRAFPSVDIKTTSWINSNRCKILLITVSYFNKMVCFSKVRESKNAKKKQFDVAVIGAGGAGIMAYLRSVLNHDQTVLFTGGARDKKRARGTWVF